MDFTIPKKEEENINKSITSPETYQQSGTECSFSTDSLIDKFVQLEIDDTEFPNGNLRCSSETTFDQFQEEAEQQLQSSSGRNPRKSVLSDFDPCYLSTPEKVDKQESHGSSGDLQLLERKPNNVSPIIIITHDAVVSAVSNSSETECSNLPVHTPEEENAELQLNASQQVRATLELQLRQKEEIIIKSQAEDLPKDQVFKQEIKQLKEKLEEKCIINDNSQNKDLQETVKNLKAREVKLVTELNARKNGEQNYRKVMEEYEKNFAEHLSELQKLSGEYESAKRHLANLELAFSDVHQKYERSKKIIDGYKCNKDALGEVLGSTEDTVIRSGEKYESLKAHAKAQIEKSNQEMHAMREEYEAKIHKLSAIIKRLEIRNASLTDSLDQKTKECSALAALCDELTGKV